MAITWRPQHEVHPNRPPTPDLLALDGERVVGRLFQITHNGNAGKWFWTMMASRERTLAAPICGIADEAGEAQECLRRCYDGVVPAPAPRRGA
jgi:hypothetical protein